MGEQAVHVDAAIRDGRLLTGADLDVESVRRDRSGNYWFGDEFGPYLIKADAQGTVLRSVIPLPGVYAPENKDVLMFSDAELEKVLLLDYGKLALAEWREAWSRDIRR